MARALTPSAACRSRARGRIAPTNLRTHADQVQHPRRPTSAPVRNRYILFYSSFSSSFFYLPMGTPRGPVSLPDRSRPFVRDFGPLIPALRVRRLHGRLGGQSGFLAPQKYHQPEGYSRQRLHALRHNVVVHHEAAADLKHGIPDDLEARSPVEPDGPGVPLIDLQPE